MMWMGNFILSLSCIKSPKLTNIYQCPGLPEHLEKGLRVGGWTSISAATVTKVLFWLCLKEYAPTPPVPLLSASHFFTISPFIYLHFYWLFNSVYLPAMHCCGYMCSVYPVHLSSLYIISSILHSSLVSNLKRPLTWNHDLQFEMCRLYYSVLVVSWRRVRNRNDDSIFTYITFFFFFARRPYWKQVHLFWSAELEL